MIASKKQQDQRPTIDEIPHRNRDVSSYMKNTTGTNIYYAVILLFSICWMGFIGMDYFQKHPGYLLNIQSFNFYITFGGILLICAGISSAFTKFPKKLAKVSRGISIYAIVLIMVSITFASANMVVTELTKVNSGIGGLFNMLGKFIKVSFFLFSIIMSCYAAGNLFTNLLKVEFPKRSKNIIEVAIGIMLVVMLAFLFGALKLLHWFVLGPALLLIIGLNWKNTLAFLKNLLWDEIKPSKKLNFLGTFCFLVLSYLIGMSLLQNLTPWPKGWDSLSLYVNLPQLINDYHGLVKGFQPYNWSLFMSFGLVLFNSIETTLTLAFSGGVLCLFAMFPIARNTLKLNVNHSLLALLSFYLIPSIGFQSFLEQKVDLGLLFIILVIVNIILSWSKKKQKALEIKPATDGAESVVALENGNYEISYLIIAGLLTGFAFGIKLTTLFSFFGIVAIIWYLNLGSLAFLGIALLSIFGILLVKLDDMSGMRQYHLSADIVQWTLLILGIGMIAFVSLKNTKGLINSLKQSIIYTSFFVLMTIPWLGKNYIDAGKKLSFNYLMNGKSNAPVFDAKTFDLNHQKTLKNGQ